MTSIHEFTHLTHETQHPENNTNDTSTNAQTTPFPPLPPLTDTKTYQIAIKKSPTTEKLGRIWRKNQRHRWKHVITL